MERKVPKYENLILYIPYKVNVVQYLVDRSWPLKGCYAVIPWYFTYIYIYIYMLTLYLKC